MPKIRSSTFTRTSFGKPVEPQLGSSGTLKEAGKPKSWYNCPECGCSSTYWKQKLAEQCCRRCGYTWKPERPHKFSK